MWRGVLITAGAVLFLALAAGAETYRYTDRSGNIGLTNDYWSIPEAQREGATLITGEHIKTLEEKSALAAMKVQCYRYTDKDGNIIITDDFSSIPSEYQGGITPIIPRETDASKMSWYAEMKQAGATETELDDFAMAGGPDEAVISQAGIAEKLQDAVGAQMQNAFKVPETKDELLNNPLFWLSAAAVSSLIAIVLVFAYIERPGMRCMLVVMLLSAINMGIGATYAQRLMGKYDIIAKIKQMQSVTRQIRSLAGE